MTYSDNHAVVLSDGSKAAEEADNETHDADDDDEQRCAVDVVTEERKVFTERGHQYRSADNEYQTDYLRQVTSPPTIYRTERSL